MSPPQRVLEADAAEDAFHDDDDDFEVNTPKRRHRGKGRVSLPFTQAARFKKNCFIGVLNGSGFFIDCPQNLTFFLFIK